MAQPTLVASSKRALSSTSTATCTPRSAARIRLRAIGLSPPARYSVILIDCTRGSSAASEMNCSTLLAKLSYGWWTISARSRTTEKKLRPVSSALATRPAVTGGHGWSLSSGPVDAVQLPQAGEVDQAAVAGDVALVEVELAHQQLEHLRR